MMTWLRSGTTGAGFGLRLGAVNTAYCVFSFTVLCLGVILGPKLFFGFAINTFLYDASSPLGFGALLATVIACVFAIPLLAGWFLLSRKCIATSRPEVVAYTFAASMPFLFTGFAVQMFRSMALGSTEVWLLGFLEAETFSSLLLALFVLAFVVTMIFVRVRASGVVPKNIA